MRTKNVHVPVMAVALLVALLPAAAQERRIGGGPPQANFPAPPISSSQSRAELTKALDAYLAGLTAEDRFSGVVVVAKDGQVVFERAYGFADRANRRANTPTTRFNIASVGKQFTVAALRALEAEGKVKRADTLGALLPDYPNEQARTATVDQLLDHRAGVSDFFGDDFTAASPARFRSNADYFAFVAPRPLYFEPGTQQRYCNGCYIVLGEIVAKLSGLSYERYVEEKILLPHGMKSTGWPQSDAIVPDVAVGYTRRLPGGDGELRANTYAHGAAGSAAGGAYSTAADLLAFFKLGPAGQREPGAPQAAIAGGAPGTNALIESAGAWIVIVLSNLDPPAASVGTAIVKQLK